MKRVLGILAILTVLTLALPAPAFAAPEEDDRVVLGGSFTLQSGEVLEGDLVVIGGAAELEADSKVTGAVFVMGGNADIAGEVDGDVVLLGGNVNLMQTGWIHGDVSVLGGNLNRDSQAKIDGQVISGGGSFVWPLEGFEFPSYEYVRPFDTFRFRFSPLLDIFWFGFRSLLMAALAVLTVMFWPNPTDRTGKTAIGQPILSGGLGLLTFIVAPVLLIALTITIILIPVMIVAVILWVVACVFGWIAIGLEVGNRMAESFKWELQPAAAAGIGTLVVSLVFGGIGLVPCIGWIAPFLVLSVGLGAVILTRFGSREYQPAAALAPVEDAPKKTTTRKRTTTKKSE